MADLATLLLRTTARAFYTTEHILVVDALILHSTLPDLDLAFVLGMQTKTLRKICGRLKEDGLVSIQTRAERRTDGTQSYFGGGGTSMQGKERVTHKDWYYLNFHRAIDSIKYRIHRLNKHVESLGAPMTEKKDLGCPRCKSQYTDLEVMDKIDPYTGDFLCQRCGHALDQIEEDERTNENESVKRMNSQLEKILNLLREIDATNVPENDFQTALSKQKPVLRNDANPGQLRTEVVDLPNRNLQSTKGLAIVPEKIAVQVQDDEDVKKESEVSEAAARREKEARQNALPEWISKSTVSGDVTTVGAKEERMRMEREAASVVKEDGSEEKKPVLKNGAEEDVMAAYWEELAKAQAEEAAARAKSEEEEEEDDDEDDFEDVDVTGTPANGTPLPNGHGVNGLTPSGLNTPNLDSSNATDDERETKRARVEEPVAGSSMQQSNGGGAALKPAEDTPAASDADDDEDELEFENV